TPALASGLMRSSTPLGVCGCLHRTRPIHCPYHCDNLPERGGPANVLDWILEFSNSRRAFALRSVVSNVGGGSASARAPGRIGPGVSGLEPDLSTHPPCARSHSRHRHARSSVSF